MGYLKYYTSNIHESWLKNSKFPGSVKVLVLLAREYHSLRFNWLNSLLASNKQTPCARELYRRPLSVREWLFLRVSREASYLRRRKTVADLNWSNSYLCFRVWTRLGQSVSSSRMSRGLEVSSVSRRYHGTPQHPADGASRAALQRERGSFEIALKIFATNDADLFHASNLVIVGIEGSSREKFPTVKITNELSLRREPLYICSLVAMYGLLEQLSRNVNKLSQCGRSGSGGKRKK